MPTPDSSPVPVPAARLVAYQPGAVVSRMLLKKEAGSVTVFAFDEGQGLSEHTAPFDALVMVLEGQGQFRIEDSNYVLEAGETLVLPAGRPHAVKAPSRFKMLLVMIRSAA
jgi:quercetin dioxygenase-like cupin family protein